MADERDPPAPSADDPDLEALAKQILDGGPVDWSAMPSHEDGSDISQLRVLADIAAVHRDLSATLTPGTQLGPYEILSAIGSGGMDI